MDGKYSIELFTRDNQNPGIERVLVRHDSLAVARALYKAAVRKYPDQLVMLCEVNVLARSDRSVAISK